MSSNLRSIADSLATGLQSVTWSISSTVVERKNWASIDVDGMVVPRVIVVPGSAESTRVSRTHMQMDYLVNVFVGRQVHSDAEVDSVSDLADSVMRRVRAHSYPASVSWPDGVTSPQSVAIELNPDDALNERNVWRAVITATYRVHESISIA